MAENERQNPSTNRNLQNSAKEGEEQKNAVEESDKPKSLEKIVEEQLDDGKYLYRQRNSVLFFSSLSAGMDIGFSVLFITVITTLFKDILSDNLLHAVASVGYPVGFIMVIIGKSVLFTEQTTLSVLPILDGSRKIFELLKLWGFVLLGNLLGGFVISCFIIWVGPDLNAASEESIIYIAGGLIKHKSLTLFGSAILAGWLMGMVSWLATSSQETISRVVLVIIITYFIGVSNLHHSIVGSIEIFSGLLLSEEIKIVDYLRFLLFAVTGNAVGGIIFVAVMKYKSLEY